MHRHLFCVTIRQHLPVSIMLKTAIRKGNADAMRVLEIGDEDFGRRIHSGVMPELEIEAPAPDVEGHLERFAGGLAGIRDARPLPVRAHRN